MSERKNYPPRLGRTDVFWGSVLLAVAVLIVLVLWLA